MKTPPLTPGELALLFTVFQRHPEIREVRLFGSRSKGSHTRRSDVDLAVWGDVDRLQAEAIAAELDELPLPYRYDVQPFNTIKFVPLREHIERRGIRIYPENGTAHPIDVEACFQELMEGRKDFWTLVLDISHEDLLALVDFGLQRGGGSYRKLATLFHLGKDEYRRLMDFLRRRQCMLDVQRYRKA